jgi:UDP-N-acetylenolpyruvoylglucosamine reductase
MSAMAPTATATGSLGKWESLAAEWRDRVSPATVVRCEEPLGPKTTLRVGGAARVYAEPAGLADLQSLLRSAGTSGVAVFPLGRGSNLIVPDEGVDGLVVSLAHEVWSSCEVREGGRIWAGAGLRLKHLCGVAAKAGLAGFEFLEGIPGSVGGALRMNAGAMGGWIFDVVEEALVISLDGELATRSRASLRAGYRACQDLEDAIALGALLRAPSGAAAREPGAPAPGIEAIARQTDVYRRKRQESQPKEPSAGCIFKNPPGMAAGRLIDECGLKGRRIGDAEVSPVHANFIINRGGATGGEVLELIRQVRARVREVKGVELQPEAILYGRQWEDVW